MSLYPAVVCYNARQYNTINTAHYNTIQYNAIQYSTILIVHVTQNNIQHSRQTTIRKITKKNQEHIL